MKSLFYHFSVFGYCSFIFYFIFISVLIKTLSWLNDGNLTQNWTLVTINWKFREEWLRKHQARCSNNILSNAFHYLLDLLISLTDVSLHIVVKIATGNTIYVLHCLAISSEKVFLSSDYSRENHKTEFVWPVLSYMSYYDHLLWSVWSQHMDWP